MPLTLVALGVILRGGLARPRLAARFVAARLAAAGAVAAVVWGWAVGQYPFLLQGELTIADAAAAPATLRAVLVSLAVGGLLVVPSLVGLFFVAQRAGTTGADTQGRENR